MDLRQHTIQLGATHGAAATQPGDGGAMSSELYLAVCGGKKEEAMALLRRLHYGGAAADDRAAGIQQVSAKRNNVLHLAAEHGHAELIHDLVSFGGKSLLSAQNSALDTPLHCAARAGHCKAVSVLVQLALDYGDESALWCKNAAGDTALHLAARLGHGVAVEAMVSAASGLASEVNHAGVSPLYLAVMSRSRRDHVQRWDSRNIIKAIEKTSDSLAVVAVLVAGVAFTAANNLPGSYEQEGNVKGMAVLRSKTIFKCFLILDGVALVTSILAVVLLVYGKASRSARSWKSFAAALHCIWASLISMLLAFYAAIAAVTSTTGVYDIRVFVVNLVLVVLFIVLSAFVSPPVSHLIMCKFLWQCGLKGCRGVVRRRISQQYPVVGAFVFNLLLFRAAHYVILFAGFIIVSTLRGGSDVR
ncbi:unnamed protein product [Triticum turgidum subsp. durum]|uniref:PGG domain-containing protein n=1 Tax=Triticum turgidum subsp. durum TaxID=4567 RepID=A0A9R0XEP0_TRITD|nr:unnamed protein product [Triticum turgidum subsp. durum]